jgi:Flp pilus assembly pilin Flp
MNLRLLLRALLASTIAFMIPLGTYVLVGGRTHRAAGQGLVEYALILGFVTVLVLVALRFLQPAIATSLNNVANSF